MHVVIKQKTVYVGIRIERDGRAEGRVLSQIEDHEHDENVLPLHYSLMGEVNPVLVPLPVDYSFNNDTSYRYDWVVGVAEPYTEWDWHAVMRGRERALSVQLLIDCGDSGFSFSDMSPVLLGLHPSLHSVSWLEKHAELLREGVKGAAELAKLIPSAPPGLPDMLKAGSNFISSGEKDEKNWWIYRFLDMRKKCCVVEWNINHKVLEEYGPLLRGSIVLAFHGAPKDEHPIIMLLLPRLGFDRSHDKLSNIKFLPPPEELETEERRVELRIKPV
jgi:hypothetical protein